MRCSRCQAENRPGRRFCSRCGASLPSACASCGFSNDPDDEFCGGCAARLPAAPASASQGDGTARRVAAERQARLAASVPDHLTEKILRERSALEGEQRQIAILLADVAGLAGLAGVLDPAEAHRIIDRCFDLIAHEVHLLEGMIDRYTEAGAAALFGAHIAHEDSARRAVHA